MRHDSRPSNTFLNRREWGSYLIALQTAASCPRVMDAVKSGRAWFTQNATQASNWLVGDESLDDKVSVG